jgi:hypothetical protein
VTTKGSIGRGAAAAVVTTLVVLILAGCGSAATSSSTSPTPSPTASASGSGLASQFGALRTYLGQAQPIMSQLATTMASLPEAVRGIGAKPGGSWTTAAGKLDGIATQLGNESDSLAALTPPTLLAPVQDVAVKGIRDAQAAVTKTATALNRREATSATGHLALEAQIATLEAKLYQLSQGLLGAIQGAAAAQSPVATP